MATAHPLVSPLSRCTRTPWARQFQAVIRLYTDSTGDVTRDGFIRFLEGPHAALFDEGKRLVHHDMDRPLHEYFINASHNTYLIGHQLHGKSSVDGYIRALLLGYAGGERGTRTAAPSPAPCSVSPGREMRTNAASQVPLC